MISDANEIRLSRRLMGQRFETEFQNNSILQRTIRGGPTLILRLYRIAGTRKSSRVLFGLKSRATPIPAFSV